MAAKLGFFEVGADIAVGVEVDLVLLLRPPLAVVEDHGDGRDVLAHAGQRLLQAHAPGAVADIGDGRPVGRGDLGADRGRDRHSRNCRSSWRRRRSAACRSADSCWRPSRYCRCRSVTMAFFGIAFSSSRNARRGAIGEPSAWPHWLSSPPIRLLLLHLGEALVLVAMGSELQLPAAARAASPRPPLWHRRRRRPSSASPGRASRWSASTWMSLAFFGQ